MDFFLIKESFLNLKSNILRTFLSVTGVIFGVASVVAMMGIGLGAQAQMEKMLEALGSQNIHIKSLEMNTQDARNFALSSIGLTQEDAKLMKEMYPQSKVTQISTWKFSESNYSLDDVKFELIGVDEEFFEVQPLPLDLGRWMTSYELLSSSPLCVLGYEVTKGWFSSPQEALGKYVRLNEMWCQVIGTLKSTQKKQEEEVSAQIQFLRTDFSIFFPQKAGNARLGELSWFLKVKHMMMKLPSQEDPLQAAFWVRQSLDKRHHGVKVYEVQSALEIVEQKKKASQMFTIFLLIIATVSLFVGGIGIANVMLASMIERIKEVGLRRALGAKKHHIVKQFLLESLMICWVGGFLGWLLGWAGSFLTGYFTKWPIETNILVPLLAIFISSVVGLLAGLWPALVASKISPIVALQGRS